MKKPFVCAVALLFFLSFFLFSGGGCDFRLPQEELYALDQLTHQVFSRNASLTLGSWLRGAFWSQTTDDEDLIHSTFF